MTTCVELKFFSQPGSAVATFLLTLLNSLPLLSSFKKKNLRLLV